MNPAINATHTRIDQIKFHELLFDVRRVLLDGGFSEREVELIIDVIGPPWRRGERLNPQAVAAGLHAKGFPKAEARELATALARA